MAFRLKKKESPRKGFQRLFQEQYHNAIEHLSGPPEMRQQAIHETRKSFKRIRALLRLLRNDIGGLYDNENARIRDLSAILSPYRDADAMLETLEKLHRALPDLFDPAMFDTASQCLENGRQQVLQQDAGYPQAAAGVLGQLAETRENIPDWPLPDHLDGVGKVLNKSYRRARKAAKHARQSGTVEDFHTWRKRVKDLLYQSQTLSKTPLSPPKSLRKGLETLGEMLGEHHDLSVFEELLQREDVFPDREHAAEVLKVVVQRRHELERQACANGKALFNQHGNRLVS